MNFQFNFAAYQDKPKNIYYLLKHNLPEFERIIKNLHSSQKLVTDVIKNEMLMALSGSLREGFPVDWDDKYDSDLLFPLPGLDLSNIDIGDNFDHHPLVPAYLNITIPKEHVFKIFEVLPIKQNLIGYNQEGKFYLNTKNAWAHWDELFLPILNSFPFTIHTFSKSINQVAIQLRIIFDQKFRKIAKLNQEAVLPVCLKFVEEYGMDIIFPEQLLKLFLNNIERLNDEFLDIDIIPSSQCSNKWPPIAAPWIDRQRHWPSPEVIKNILEQGFHIVFKSCDEYQNRLSFSSAELSLFENLNNVQRNVFYLWKAFYYCDIKLRKAYIKKGVQGIILEKDESTPDNVITSYHIKTTFFWFVEESPAEFWEQSNVFERSIASLLQKLLDYIKNENLPHYFIPEHNLFYNGKEGSDATPLLLREAADKLEYILNLISKEGPDSEWSNVLNDINITVSDENINRIIIYIFAFLILYGRYIDGKLITINPTNISLDLD